ANTTPPTTGTGSTAATTTNALQIRIGAAAVGSVGLAASPATLPANGGTTLLTATVNDTSGNVLPGVQVTFAIDTSGTSAGTGSFSATVANTDGNGRATTQFTTTRTTTVTATAGVVTPSGGSGGTGSTTTAAQTAKVTVHVNPTPSIPV